MKPKILFVVTSHADLGDTGKKTGYFLSEVTHPYSVLCDNFDIDIVSPQGGNPPVDGFDLNDPINKKFWEDAEWQYKMNNTMTPDDVDASLYKAIFYAGGHGAMWDFPDNTKLARIAQQIYEAGGIVAAVCHGPAGLLPIKLANGHYLIEDKKLDSFTNAEEKANGTDTVVPFLLEDALIEEGATFDCADKWQSHVVVDGRLITGQNPQSALEVGQQMKKHLKK